jgi:hypothetical protein
VARAFAERQRGDPALHFVARTTEGEKFTNNSLKGKVVLSITGEGSVVGFQLELDDIFASL